MTPARRKALEWLHKNGEFCLGRFDPEKPTSAMLTRMRNCGEMVERQEGGAIYLSLTDKGRYRLHSLEAGV